MRRRWLIRAAAAVLAAIAIIVIMAVCSYEPSRQYRRVPSVGPAVATLPAGTSLAAPGQLDLSHHSIFECRAAGERPGPYSFAFIELDDQGFLWEPRQVATLEHHITSVGEGHGVIIVAFVHGWNHSAALTDNNVACFQQVTEAVALLENAVNAASPRAVVGVYFGWRGSTYRITALNKMISFWYRLAASDRVGRRGDLLRVLTTLSHLRQTLKGKQPGILAMAAHSMGARALFAAVGDNLKESLARASLGEDMLGTLGDIVVLINPALAASEYKFIDAMVREPEVQRLAPTEPTLVLMSSPADRVTRILYPLGESIRSGGQSIQPSADRSMLVQSAANYTPFVTHRLRVMEGRVPDPNDHGTASSCGCRFVCASELPIVRGVLEHPERRELFRYSDIRVFPTDDFEHPIYRLALQAQRPGNLPAVVIQADGEIMPEHGESFTPALIEFLVRLVNAKVASLSRPPAPRVAAQDSGLAAPSGRAPN